MKFNLILEELLLEATADEIYEKYYSDIKRSLFDRIAMLDPATKMVGDKIEKLGKYVKILIDLYRKDGLKSEDYPKAKKYLQLIYQYKLPVGNIKSLGDLYELVKDKMVSTSTPVEEVLEELSPETYDYLMDGKEWYVFKPLTVKAASYLGSAEWCTTWGEFCPNSDYKDRTNHFASHNNSGPLFIMINKQNQNDRYQLHFQSDQLKNYMDKEVSPRNMFFEERPELGALFFPAAFGKSEEPKEIDKELSRSKFITSERALFLLKKKSEIYGFDLDSSSIINLLTSNDSNGFERVINQDYSNDDEFTNHAIGVVVKDNHVEFEMPNDMVPEAIRTVESYISNIRMAKQSAWDWVRDGFYNGDTEEELQPYLAEYYEKHRITLLQTFGNVAQTYDKFADFFGEGFYDSESIWNAYIEKAVEQTTPNLENAYDELIEDVEKYIFNFYKAWHRLSFDITKPSLIEFIMKNNIVAIEDIGKFFEDFVYEYDLPTDEYYYDSPEYDYDYPTHEYMNDYIEDYFTEMIEKMDELHNDEGLEKGKENCARIRGEFTQILNKEFDENGAFENEHVFLQILSPWSQHFTCKDGGQVEVKFINKDKNTKYEGWIKIENIHKYLTNHDLFEAHNKFKKLIKD